MEKFDKQSIYVWRIARLMSLEFFTAQYNLSSKELLREAWGWLAKFWLSKTNIWEISNSETNRFPIGVLKAFCEVLSTWCSENSKYSAPPL